LNERVNQITVIHL